MKKNTINPALNDLQVFIGDWTIEISKASFLPDLSMSIQSIASFKWYEDGEFLVLRQGTKETPHATWLISRDQDSSNYVMSYYDDRQVSRIYEMSFKNNIWKIWRNAPNFVQSFEAKISNDQNIISGAWGKSSDGKKWEHDFDLVYTRVK